jgi:hypothetical protein
MHRPAAGGSCLTYQSLGKRSSGDGQNLYMRTYQKLAKKLAVCVWIAVVLDGALMPKGRGAGVKRLGKVRPDPYTQHLAATNGGNGAARWGRVHCVCVDGRSINRDAVATTLHGPPCRATCAHRAHGPRRETRTSSPICVTNSSHNRNGWRISLTGIRPKIVVHFLRNAILEA